MGYLGQEERDTRLSKVQAILEEKDLDLALVYYDEFNIGNGWYLTGWCPQFESGAVLVLKDGSAMLLGGPESEPFAKLDSAITETRNFPVFMGSRRRVPERHYHGLPVALCGTDVAGRRDPSRGTGRWRTHARRLLPADHGRV